MRCKTGAGPQQSPPGRASVSASSIVAQFTFIPWKNPACGLWPTMNISPLPRPTPITPPTTATTTASPTNSPSIVWRVKPSVFSTATSRVRSRIDIAIVLAETSNVANTTAPQILRMNAFTLPSMVMKSMPKRLLAFGLGRLRRVAEHVIDRGRHFGHVLRGIRQDTEGAALVLHHGNRFFQIFAIEIDRLRRLRGG